MYPLGYAAAIPVAGLSVLFGTVMAFAQSLPSTAPAADVVTRVTLHAEGTAHEIFASLARHGGVSLNWSGPADGPRRRFDAWGEPFWPAVLRACDAFGVHFVTDAHARWLVPRVEDAIGRRREERQDFVFEPTAERRAQEI